MDMKQCKHCGNWMLSTYSCSCPEATTKNHAMKMMHDRFEAWIRERCSGCLEQYEIDQLCTGELDFDSGEYTFNATEVQGQWEAWQEAAAPISLLREALALHHSMVLSGEMVSPTSEACFRLAMDSSR